MNDAMTYELFIRNAFKCGRWEDPAQLANADIFNLNNIEKVKIGIGYAMEIYNTQIVNEPANREMEPFDERGNEYLRNVLAAESLQDIIIIINAYKEEIHPYLTNF